MEAASRIEQERAQRTLLFYAISASVRAMTEFQCWFCGQGIERADAGALLMNIESLWRWVDAARTKDDPWQTIYVHSRCAKERMAGATMSLEPHIFGDES